MKNTIVLLVGLCLSSLAHAGGYQAVLKESDIPKLKCADSAGGYYVFYEANAIDERGPFVVAVPMSTSTLAYEMVTTSSDLSNASEIKFSMYDPIQAIRSGEEAIYEMTLKTQESNLVLYSVKSQKSYDLACVAPVKGVDYE